MDCFCSCVIVFFFFKQKTAYEMRISDWSSDVCSSDLQVVGLRGRYAAAERALPAALREPERPGFHRGAGRGGACRPLCAGRAEGRWRKGHGRSCGAWERTTPTALRPREGDKIGRAACRERGGRDG